MFSYESRSSIELSRAAARRYATVSAAREARKARRRSAAGNARH